MIMGGIVIVIVAIFTINYFNDKKGQMLPAISTDSIIGKEYTVVKGDTLWNIAESSYGSGYNWVDVKKANNLKTDKIEVGQKLTIPEVATRKPTVTQTTTSKTNAQTIEGTSYTVVKGDTLWKISVRTYGDGYKWTEIAKLNKLVNPNLIHSGNVLQLPK